MKRATGNEKDTEVDTKKTKGPKAGELLNVLKVSLLIRQLAVNAITKVILSTTQGPAIQIRDF